MMGVMECTVRPATSADLLAISAIYDHEVTHSIATFDTTAQGTEPWQSRLDSTSTGDHLLVAEVDAAVVGFAYSSAHRPRPAYTMTREVSVYLAGSARGQGLGRLLYDDLLGRLAADGVHAVVAVIALPNAASEALHVHHGFHRAGVLEEVGEKFGRRIDTALYQRLL